VPLGEGERYLDNGTDWLLADSDSA